jgi:DNA modification methylase
MTWEIRQGRNLDRLAEMPDESVQTCITSPPYWGLRDYGEDDQLGLEPTPEEYVENMVAVFREVRRVLRDDGTLWLNLGDSYASGEVGRHDGRTKNSGYGARHPGPRQSTKLNTGLKPKDLVGIPWRVAFALQADGWYLRSDIIWHKPNPMPESVTDRPTKAHEYLFLLTKSPRYYYDADAIREAHSTNRTLRLRGSEPSMDRALGQLQQAGGYHSHGRNKRSVWTVTTKPFSGAHFAVFPPDLIEPCVLAGAAPTACGECGAPYERILERTSMVIESSERVKIRNQTEARTATSGKMVRPPSAETLGWQPTCEHDDDSGQSVVLDIFSGSGTTGMVALRHDRSYIGLELNPEYAEMSRNRIRDDAPLFNIPLEAA